MDTPLTGRKPSLFDLYQQYKFDVSVLAEKTGVDEEAIKRMLGYSPVSRNIAYPVLSKLSSLFHQDYSVDTVDIPLIPLFSEVYASHHITVETLAENAGVPLGAVLLMAQDKGVFQDFALKVLSALSAMTRQRYTPDTVDVAIITIMVEEGNQSQVARLMKQIEDESAAARRAMEDFASGQARHEFINKRTENIGKYTGELGDLVGKDTALDITIQLSEQ